mgnify:CR=1 FL=1
MILFLPNEFLLNIMRSKCAFCCLNNFHAMKVIYLIYVFFNCFFVLFVYFVCLFVCILNYYSFLCVLKYCICIFFSLANHLVSCSKRTCYSNKPEVKWFEYDDEQEEFNPFEPYVEGKLTVYAFCIRKKYSLYIGVLHLHL